MVNNAPFWNDPGMLGAVLLGLLLLAAIAALVWLMRRMGQPFDGAGAADRGWRRAAVMVLVAIAVVAGAPGGLLVGFGLMSVVTDGDRMARQFGGALTLLGGMLLLLAAPFGIGAWRAIRRGVWG